MSRAYWVIHHRSLEPNRVSGMDVYSSTLWHLRKEVALSHLAHDLVEKQRMAPESWCAVGNCFRFVLLFRKMLFNVLLCRCSMKREHDVAMKCFMRAVQINPGFTYAHTLIGHEYIAMEDNEKAMQSFQTAIRCDRRHYNAWYLEPLPVFARPEKKLLKYFGMTSC